MTEEVVPASDAIWGASELTTNEEWQAIAESARRLIAAGAQLRRGGTMPEDQARAAEPEWQGFSERMVEAARQILVAVENRDEEALFDIGNDALYPPCEECHNRYMPK